MNSRQLKYGEIFCFLALFFLIMLLFLSHRQQKMEGEAKRLSTNYDNLSRKYFPPNISINNTKYPFNVGKATLTTELKIYINGIVPDIIKNFQEYDINTIEVIGHTDGQKVNGLSNLDSFLIKVADSANQEIGELKAGSNADLGLMRALAVIKELQKQEQLIKLFKEKEIDEKTVFRAYSAGQLYLPDRTIAPPGSKDDEKRRRIQIRFTKLTDE